MRRERTLSALIFAACLWLSAGAANATYYVIGDSFGQGQAAAFCGYTCLLEVKLNATIVNKSVSGGMCGDLIPQALSVSLGAGDLAIVEVGTNDQRHNGVNATLQAAHMDCMRALVGWLAIANKVTARSIGGETGAWTDTGIEGIGRSTYPAGTIGSSKTFTGLCGTALYSSVINVDTGGSAAPYSVSVDGVLQGNYVSMISGLTSINGSPYADGAKRFSVASGCHSLTITQTGAGYLYVQWAAGNQQTVFPTVVMTNIIRQGPGPGCGYPVFGGSDANVMSMNGDRTTLTSGEFQPDGIDARLADIESKVNNTTHLASTDCLHPVQLGHNEIAPEIWSTSFGTSYSLP